MLTTYESTADALMLHHHSTSAAKWDHCTGAPSRPAFVRRRLRHIHRQLLLAPRTPPPPPVAPLAPSRPPPPDAPRANPASLHRPCLSCQAGLHLHRPRLSRRAGLRCHQLRLSMPSRSPTPPPNAAAPTRCSRLPCPRLAVRGRHASFHHRCRHHRPFTAIIVHFRSSTPRSHPSGLLLLCRRPMPSPSPHPPPSLAAAAVAAARHRRHHRCRCLASCHHSSHPATATARQPPHSSRCLSSRHYSHHSSRRLATNRRRHCRRRQPQSPPTAVSNSRAATSSITATFIPRCRLPLPQIRPAMAWIWAPPPSLRAVSPAANSHAAVSTTAATFIPCHRLSLPQIRPATARIWAPPPPL